MKIPETSGFRVGVIIAIGVLILLIMVTVLRSSAKITSQAKLPRKMLNLEIKMLQEGEGGWINKRDIVVDYEGSVWVYADRSVKTERGETVWKYKNPIGEDWETQIGNPEYQIKIEYKDGLIIEFDEFYNFDPESVESVLGYNPTYSNRPLLPVKMITITEGVFLDALLEKMNPQLFELLD